MCQDPNSNNSTFKFYVMSSRLSLSLSGWLHLKDLPNCIIAMVFNEVTHFFFFFFFFYILYFYSISGNLNTIAHTQKILFSIELFLSYMDSSSELRINVEEKWYCVGYWSCWYYCNILVWYPPRAKHHFPFYYFLFCFQCSVLFWVLEVTFEF